MRNFALVVLAVFVFQSASADEKKTKEQPPSKPTLKQGEYAVFIEGQYRIFKFREHEKVRVGESCFLEAKSKCQALQSIKNKKSMSEVAKPGMLNPAGTYCKAFEARNLVATDSNRDEIEVCYFKDGSLIDSWGLFALHYPSKPKIRK